jgi:hypothetical protein
MDRNEGQLIFITGGFSSREWVKRGGISMGALGGRRVRHAIGPSKQIETKLSFLSL